MDNDKIAAEIRHRCAENNLTIEALAEKAGISKSTIYNLMGYKTDGFSPKVARKLAEALNCPVGVLMGIAPENAKPVKQPAPAIVGLTVFGDFTIIPGSGNSCRIQASEIKIMKKDLENQLKQYLFQRTDVSDELLQKVKEYARGLVSEAEGSSSP